MIDSAKQRQNTGQIDVTAGALLGDWRRRRGFSQLELALSADCSARHLSFVETGRTRPSRETILRFVDCLDIPVADGNSILAAAGLAPSLTTEPKPADRATDPRWRVIDQMLEKHAPLPAYVRDSYYNIVAVNEPSRRNIERLTSPGETWNVIDLGIKPSRYRDALLNRPEVAGVVLIELRHLVARTGGAPRFVALYDLVRHHMQDLEFIPDMQDRLLFPPTVLRIGSEIVSFVSLSTVVGFPNDSAAPEYVVVHQFPAGWMSQSLLRRHRTHRPGDAGPPDRVTLLPDFCGRDP